MTREEVATKIRWPLIIWAAGIVNVLAMVPQLWSLLTTQVTEGLSLPMFWIFFIIQICFSLEGYFKRNKMLMWCLGLSAIVSGVIISLIYLLRNG